MRWFVEVSRIGESGVADEYCVDAKQWQAALQEARKLRGDGGALAQFSIELLDYGYRAVDPTLKLRYLVTRAPDTAKLTGSSANSVAPHAHSGSPGSVSPVPRPSSHTPPRAAALAPRLSGAPRSHQLVVPDDPVPPPPVTPGALAALAEVANVEEPVLSVTGGGALVSFEVVRERSEEPRADSPITYRELAFAVAPGASRSQVEALLNDRYRATLAAIEDRPAGKFVQLAVFDHVFKRRPERPPLGTFAWKDWRGAPVLAFPGFGEAPMGPVSRVPPPPGSSTIPPSNGVRESSPPSGAHSPGSLAPSPMVTIEPPRNEVAPVARLSLEAAPVALEAASPSTEPGPVVIEPLTVVIEVAEAAPVNVESPAVSAEPSVVSVESPAVSAESPAVSAESPAVSAEPSVVSVESPAVSVESPAVSVESPAVSVESPAVSVESPAVSVESPAVSAEPSGVNVESPTVAAAASVEALAAAVEPPAAAVKPPAAAPVSSPGFEINFEAMPFNAAPVAESKSAAGHERVSRPRQGLVGRRRAGEDLISELFEYMHELHFQRDIAAGADFVLSVLNEVLPCEGVLIHVFDINTGHFVVVRAKGPNASAVLLQRMPDQDPFVLSVMRSPRAISVPNAAQDARFNGLRWRAVGVAPRAALCGAVHQGGRYLGLIELVNPQGGTPFHFSELNALDYICEQFAEFLSNKPLVLAADVVLARV